MGSYLTKIFLIDDDSIFCRGVQRALENDGDTDVTYFNSGEDFLSNLHQLPDIVIVDFHLPGKNGIEILKQIKQYNDETAVIILSGQERIEIVVEAYQNGADAYIIKNGQALFELRNSVKNLSKSVSYRKEAEHLREQILDRNKYNTVIGESDAILKVLKMIQKLENNNISVLITGETGTGKDVIAHAIHYNSVRRKKPFVIANMPAIPADLVESELFGHEKGAFTGADARRIGKFEEANSGTIFLDEIGDMDIQLQSKILRVLQEMKITRLGSNVERELDVRVIAATNRNLVERVKSGLFREDLYYRLQGFLVKLPPLRERGNDIALLANHFLNRFCEKNRLGQKSISREAMKMILQYPWYGNVRELKSLLERASLINESGKIETCDLIFSEAVSV